MVFQDNTSKNQDFFITFSAPMSNFRTFWVLKNETSNFKTFSGLFRTSGNPVRSPLQNADKKWQILQKTRSSLLAYHSHNNPDKKCEKICKQQKLCNTEMRTNNSLLTSVILLPASAGLIATGVNALLAMLVLLLSALVVELIETRLSRSR